MSSMSSVAATRMSSAPAGSDAGNASNIRMGTSANTSTTCSIHTPNNLGRLCFVLISYYDYDQQMQQNQLQWTYWPALVYPSHGALQKSLGQDFQDGSSFKTAVLTEWKTIHKPQVDQWHAVGCYAADDDYRGADAAGGAGFGPYYQLALLLGQDLPPTVHTRSWPVFPKELVKNCPWGPLEDFTEERAISLRTTHSTNALFLRALDIAEQYRYCFMHAMTVSMVTCSANGIGAAGIDINPDTAQQQQQHSQQQQQDQEDDDEGSVVNIDATGTYNVPTPIRPSPRTSTASKNALSQITVQGAALGMDASNGTGIDVDQQEQGGLGRYEDGNVGGKPKTTDDSPQRPKHIDFNAVVAATTTTTAAAANKEEEQEDTGNTSKHVSFSPGTLSHAATTAPAATSDASSTPTPASTNTSTAANTRRATPSPTQASRDAVAASQQVKDDAKALKERYDRLRTLITPAMEWKLVWPTLKAHGWTHRPGRGLVSYYYCCSKYAHETVGNMLKYAKRGDEYFCNDDELKMFCRDKLGWVGGVSDGGEVGGGGKVERSNLSKEERTGSAGRSRPRRTSSAKQAAVNTAGGSAPVQAAADTAKDDDDDDEIVCDESQSGGESDSSDSSFSRVSPQTMIDLAQSGPGGALCSPESYATSASSGEKEEDAEVEQKTPAKKGKAGKPAKGAKKKPKAAKKQKVVDAKKKKEVKKPTSSCKAKPARAQKVSAKKPASARTPTPSPPSPAESSSSSSASSSVCPTTILRDQDAWRLLMARFKFRHQAGKFYCLPGVDPKSEDSLEGRDYFKRLTDLRRHLCAFGIPMTGINGNNGKTKNGRGGGTERRSSRNVASEEIDVEALLGSDDYHSLNAWVRYAVVRSLGPNQGVPSDIERLPQTKFIQGGAWALLKKLGYKWYGDDNIPSSQGRSAAFGRHEDLCAHLARYGLASNGSTAVLTSKEHLRLELFIAGCSSVNTFERIEPEDADYDWLKQTTLTSPAPTTTTPAASAAEGVNAIVASPSSVKTNVPAPPNANDGSAVEPPEPLQPPQEVTALNSSPSAHDNSPSLSATSALTATPLSTGQYADNGLPEVDDGEAREAAREAAEALKLSKENTDLTDHLDAAAETSATAAAAEPMEMCHDNDHGLMTQPDDDTDDFGHQMSDRSTKYSDERNPLSGSVRSMINRLEDAEDERQRQAAAQSVAAACLAKQDDAGADEDTMASAGGDRPTRKRRAVSSADVSAVEVKKKKAAPKKAQQRQKKPTAAAAAKRASPRLKEEKSSNADGQTSSRKRTSKASPSIAAAKRTSPRLKEEKSSNDGGQTSKRTSKVSPPESSTLASTNASSRKRRTSSSSPASSTDSTDDSPATKMKLPDMQRTVAEKLRCCQSVLHSDEVEDMFTNSSRVSPHVKAIASFLSRTMTAYGGAKRKGGRFPPSSMYVCGAPGTGKTTTLNKCIEDCSNEYGDARFIFRNVVSCGADGPSAAKRLLDDLKVEVRAGGDASYDKIEKRLSFSPNKDRRVVPLILVLDEIDMMLSAHMRSDKLSGGDRFIEKLLGWAADPHVAFGLIGISNGVDNDQTRRLQDLGTISKILVFGPYREQDLISILEDRVGTQIIAEPALKMVSRKVAAGSGDARKALDMTAKAVRKCETELSEADLGKSADISYPIVKLPHMMRSIREGLGMKHTDAIMALPQAAKIVLCVAVALSTVSPAWKVIKMKDLKKYCAEASRHGLMERLNIDHLFDIVQMLSDSGLLLSGDGNDLRYAIYSMDVHEIPLMLGVQLDDVECALEKTLMGEAFYKSMVDYVKKNHREPNM